MEANDDTFNELREMQKKTKVEVECQGVQVEAR